MTPAKTTVWPAIIKSLEWLKRQGVIDPAKVGGLFTAAQISAAAAGALVDRKMLADLNRELQASAAAGEGRAEWQQRVRKVVTTRAYFEENLHRTLTHQAYHRGIEEVASHPAITDEFPYRLYAATNDARTRKAHAAMDGKVAHRGSPLAKEMQRLADEYNCRCTIILLSREDAVTRGIDDNAGWVEPEKEKPKAKPAPKPKATPQPKPIDPPKASESEIQAKLRELQRLIDQIDPEQERQELAKRGTIKEKLAAFKAGDAMLEKMRAAAKEAKPLPEPISWREIDSQVMRETGSANPPDYGKRVDAIRAKNAEVIDAAKRGRRDAMKSRDGRGLVNGEPPKTEAAVFWRAEIPGVKDKLSQIAKWFTSVVDTKIAIEVTPGEIGGNGYAMPWDNAIASSPNDPPRVIIHEMGHIFENDDGVKKAANEFRESRLGKRLADIPKSDYIDITRVDESHGKEYSMGEIPTTSSYLDASKRKYMGRVHPSGYTEVVSLGIEAMYDDPIKFAEEDPEYFKFIYGVLRGAFKVKPDTTTTTTAQPKSQPRAQPKSKPMAPAPDQPLRKQTLYRAADDDIVTDSASFSESLDAAKEYLNNPGFGGRTLWKTKVKVNPAVVLDLVDEDDPTTVLAKAVGLSHPGAIGADEWAPRIASEIADAGYEWVRVKESYPVDSITWIWVGGDDPEMVQID